MFATKRKNQKSSSFSILTMIDVCFYFSWSTLINLIKCCYKYIGEERFVNIWKRFVLSIASINLSACQTALSWVQYSITGSDMYNVEIKFNTGTPRYFIRWSRTKDPEGVSWNQPFPDTANHLNLGYRLWEASKRMASYYRKPSWEAHQIVEVNLGELQSSLMMLFMLAEWK